MIDKRTSEICYDPIDKGPCLALIPKFGYNPKTDQCEKFFYGGCDGNGNRFETLEECEDLCVEGD
ncbi:Kunitz/Bovine pancreatic trypsin inhibitor domain protein [Ancylostoma duodenale]|uniref:Kunitz/Bovine pancreatic trypsin inhibitor domain protein n=1 Tax=Ancylostoma duodenale TaxID=51022 RepID=A0A0C2GSH0_9BILA|nr:Kunitz/Bovine pancreatic trypsin inhibitor domain protein [Ancylostoma duodenale]